jgi:hypothetical protein
MRGGYVKWLRPGVDDFEGEVELGRAHAEAMKNTVHGMTALRATPKSRMRSRDSGRTFARAPSGRRPCDIRASVIDADANDGDETA